MIDGRLLIIDNWVFCSGSNQKSASDFYTSNRLQVANQLLRNLQNLNKNLHLNSKYTYFTLYIKT
jgi:hypothetical protein